MFTKVPGKSLKVKMKSLFKTRRILILSLKNITDIFKTTINKPVYPFDKRRKV